MDIPEFLNEFYSIIPKFDSIEKITNQLKEKCKIRRDRERITWQVVRYENGEPQSLYQIVDDKITTKNVDIQTGKSSICIVWDGEELLLTK